MFDYLEKMGVVPLVRGSHCLLQFQRKNCAYKFQEEGNKRYGVYETPVRTLTEVYMYASVSDSWFLAEHPIKEEEGFKILQYIFEHTVVTPDYKEFEKDYKEVGEQGLLVPSVWKTAFQDVLEHWCGTIELVYSLTDYTDTVEEYLAVMQQKNMECVRISADNTMVAGILGRYLHYQYQPGFVFAPHRTKDPAVDKRTS